MFSANFLMPLSSSPPPSIYSCIPFLVRCEFPRNCLHSLSACARPSCAIPCHRLPVVFVGDLKALSSTHQRDLPICGLIRRKAIRAKTNVLTARSCPLARLKAGRESRHIRDHLYRAAQLPKCRLKVPPPQSAFIVYIL